MSCVALTLLLLKCELWSDECAGSSRGERRGGQGCRGWRRGGISGESKKVKGGERGKGEER